MRLPAGRNIYILFVVLIFFFIVRITVSAPAYPLIKEGVDVNRTDDSLIYFYEKLNLFFEQYKEKDYASCIPTGFEALKINPIQYKPLYTKLEHVLWYLHDSTEAGDSAKKNISEKLFKLYDLAALNLKEHEAYFLARKSFVMETWTDTSDALVIDNYEKALALDWSIDRFYKDRLGLLLLAKAGSDAEYKFRALSLYSRMAADNPDDSLADARLRAFSENPGRIVEVRKGEWRADKTDVQKGWLYAITAYKLGMFAEATEVLEYLAHRFPDSLKFWSRLADSYFNESLWDKAYDAYNSVLILEPKSRQGLIGVGNVYKSKKEFAKARAMYQKASGFYPSWGLPIFLEGELYEQSAAACGGKEFMDKLAYVLAIEVFLRSKNTDATFVSRVQEKIRALSKYVPGRDEFIKKKKIYPAGSKVLLQGDCYGWMEKYVTIPIF